jgi:hypothetical protein
MKCELPQPWSEFLVELDQSLSEPVELHCVGGFVLTAIFGIHRSTGDLDFLRVIPPSSWEELERLAGRESLLARKHKFCLHGVGGVSDWPEDYEERLVPLDLGLKNLRLRILEPYDLLLSKLTRNSPKDREDVKAVAKKLGLSFAETYARFEKEMKPWLPRVEWHQNTLTKVWREYFRE